jgi:hypothetical protein
MMGFIISKMDMLILVTAMFAIIGFFLMGRCEEACNLQGKNTLDNLVRLSDSVTNSTKECASEIFTIPAKLECQCTSNARMFYRMVISKNKFGTAQPELTFAIYSRNTNKLLASRSITTNAYIVLYYWDRRNHTGALASPTPTAVISPALESNRFKNGFFSETGQTNEELSGIVLDPQAKPDEILDEAILVKETKPEGGVNKEFIHVIPCAINAPGSCENNKVAINDWLNVNDLTLGSTIIRTRGKTTCLTNS